MKRHTSYVLITALMIFAMLAQSWEPFMKGVIRSAVSPQPASAQSGPASVLAECHTVYLPAILNSAGGVPDAPGINDRIASHRPSQRS